MSERTPFKRADSLAATYRALFRQFGHHPSPSPDTTEIVGPVETVLDAVGWKIASLIDLHPLRFSGYSWGNYGTLAMSRCLFLRHGSPHPGCRCGFHAYRLREDAERLLNRRDNAVLLRVGLYGTLVEHTHGWRAEEQDVLAVHLPAHCTARGCDEPAAALQRRHGAWAARCPRHCGTNAVTFDELRRTGSVDVVTDL
jgi:hypothetical protein